MGISGSQENNEKKPVVIIVGGGFAGVHCAKALDKTGQFFIVLIDRKSYFLHNIATLRAAVEPQTARRIVVPYDRLLTNGCVVQAEVTSILTDGVQVHGRNDPIRFDYLVIATGSSYAFPGKVAETDGSKAVLLYDDIYERIKKAKQILIIGGGPVGIELAGEIATDFSGKQVTLVHSRETLYQPNVYQNKLYVRTQEELEKLNVKVILNDRINIKNGNDLNYLEGENTYVTEKNQTSITADLVFFCTGTRINNKCLLNSPLKTKLNPQTGRIVVNNYLQVDGYENIFAVGDVSDKEDRLAYLAQQQGEYIAKVIPAIHKKKSLPKEYSMQVNPAIFLSIGRNSGIGQLPNKGGTILGSFIVKYLKSRDLFTSRTRGTLNYTSDNQEENKSAYSGQLHSVQSVLEFTEQDARDLLAGLPVKELEPGQDFI